MKPELNLSEKTDALVVHLRQLETMISQGYGDLAFRRKLSIALVEAEALAVVLGNSYTSEVEPPPQSAPPVSSKALLVIDAQTGAPRVATTEEELAAQAQVIGGMSLGSIGDGDVENDGEEVV